MNRTLLPAMRAAHLQLWLLAVLNIFATCVTMPAFDAMGFYSAGHTIRGGLYQTQLVLLGAISALLLRRPAFAVFALLLLTWLQRQWGDLISDFIHGPEVYSFNPSQHRNPWEFLSAAEHVLIYFSVFHGLRIWLGWRIAREPEFVTQRPGQFQTSDLLEWMFTIAATLGVSSLKFAIFQRHPKAEFMIHLWINYSLFVLMIVPLMSVLLRERPKMRWFTALALLWLVADSSILGLDAWRRSGTISLKRLFHPEFRADFLILNATFALATTLNSLTLRGWGYRWQSPGSKPATT